MRVANMSSHDRGAVRREGRPAVFGLRGDAATTCDISLVNERAVVGAS